MHFSCKFKSFLYVYRHIHFNIKIIVILSLFIHFVVLSELQSSVDQLLGEKMQLCEQVEVLKKEKEELKEQVQKILRECVVHWIKWDSSNVLIFFWDYLLCGCKRYCENIVIFFNITLNSLQWRFRRKRSF